jgi:BASS family bile acid:Na+ symporter
MQNLIPHNIDQIEIHFNADNLWIVNFSLALVMFGVALDIRISDFTGLLKQPKPLIIGIFSQFFLIPLITFLIVITIDPLPSIALGLFMVAACPGGNISNFLSKLSGGNAALSVSLTAFATLTALIMTPLNFTLWSNFYPPTSKILQQVSLNPIDVAKLVVLILGIPLVLGMLVNYYTPVVSAKISRVLKPVSILIFTTFIIVAFYNNIDVFLNHVHYVLILVIFHNIILMATGFYAAKFSGLSKINQKTLTFETGVQNSGLGLLLVFSFFDELGGMAILVAFWAVWDMFSGLVLALFWSYKLKKASSL